MPTPLTISAGALSAALKALAPALKGQGSGTEYGLRLAADGGGTLRLSAYLVTYSGLLGIETVAETIGADGTAFDMALPPRPFMGFLGVAEDDKTVVSIWPPEDDAVVIMVGETASLTLRLLDVGMVQPYPRQWADMTTFEWDAPSLRGAATFASHATSYDDARPILTTICIANRSREPGVIDVVGTDSYRLAMFNLKGEIPVERNILLPAFAGPLLPDEPSMITIGVRGNGADSTPAWLRWGVGPTTYHVETKEGEFPAYRGLIPDSQPTTVTFDRARLMRVLRASERVIAGSETPKHTVPIKLTVEGPGVRFETHIERQATLSDSVATDIEGEDQKVAFNPSYFLQAVKAISAPSLTLSITDGQRPCAIRSEGFLTLLMPVRVS